MISHKQQFVFVHIPKTGGTSVSKKLGLFRERTGEVQDHRPIMEIEPFSMAHLRSHCWKSDGLYRYVRRQLGNLRRGRRRLSQTEYNNYYKFAFVRNSWARTASWYKGVTRGGVTRREYGVPEGCSFREFIITVHGDQWHLASQLYWLVDSRGQIAMDFIGKFERLQEDFDKICGVLGIEDTQLPTELMFGGDHYTRLYDDETKGIVAGLYAKEIAMFGFEFGE